jgi:alpha-L-rhamnosidase
MNMKITSLFFILVFGSFLSVKGQTDSAAAKAKSNAAAEKRASGWIASLQLNDAAKEGRLTAVVSTHLELIRDWNNEHPYSTVPAGIDPSTGKPLSAMDRQVIANSAMPRSIHENLMTGLRKDLSEDQVDAILDKYTIGKVAFTMKGYYAIVPDLTPLEDSVIRSNLEQAREQAVDFKNVKQISAIFEIYKSKCEQYLNANGRNWRALYKAFTNAVKAKKAAAAAGKSAAAADKPVVTLVSTSRGEAQSVSEFIYEHAPFPECHAATIAETPRGLVTAFFGGTKERNPDVCIYVCRKDQGKSVWTAPVNVANGIQNDTLRYACWNPVLYQVPAGDLLLFYKVGPSPSKWKGWLIRSKDGGVTWSKPQALPEGYLGPIKDKPVLLRNGVLLAPSSVEGNGWKIHFEMTSDGGKTWKMAAPVPVPPAAGGSAAGKSAGMKDAAHGKAVVTKDADPDAILAKTLQAIQPTILFHKDGSLQALSRSQNRAILECWSKDNGETWSPLAETSLPNNNSGIDGVTLADGRQLLVYNHVLPPPGKGKGDRSPLNVAISPDGENWYAALVLEDDKEGQYSYPSVIQSADGMVHIVYTWRRKKIKYAVIDPSKLELKKIENGVWPASIKKLPSLTN